jgi:4-hydroxythreonine-4-phosphate dehydrogenase
MVATLCLTSGDPGGIATEITLKAWLRCHEETPFYVVADPGWLEHMARRLELPVPVHTLADPGEAAAIMRHGLPVWPLPWPAAPECGRSAPALAGTVTASIEIAFAHVKEGKAQAMVTNPIHKATLYQAGFQHGGHTEFLGSLCGGARPVMMLATPGLV